jgi:predicted Zn-dependent protease with MMP-like domain
MGLLSKVDFRALVAEVMTTLPQEFDPYLTNLVVDCEEKPDLETLLAAGLTEEEIKQGDTLFGLYESGIDGGICSDELLEPGDLPSRIRIFRQPLMEEFPERSQLVVEVRKTVIHELAHHLGYTERDLARFDNMADPFAGRPMPWNTTLGDCR